jgi:DNA-directed RNA polymerase II subunit RPB1
LKKIKKILECVCINCGKLKVDISNERLKRAQRIRDRKRKFQEVWEICKGKNMCEVGDDPNGDEGEQRPGNKPRNNHGGCGERQPTFRLDALKIIIRTSGAKDEVDNLSSPPFFFHEIVSNE